MFTGLKNRDRITFIVYAVIGIAGAVGQAHFLRHQLVETYPFKMMGTPPWGMYELVGNVGFYVSSALAILATLFSRSLSGRLIVVIPVLISPLVFLMAFEAVFQISSYRGELMQQINFEGYTGETARYKFGFQVLGLLIVGPIVGFISGLLVEKIFASSVKKLD